MLPRTLMLTIKNRAGIKLIYFLAFAVFLAGCTPSGPRALTEGEKLIERGRYPEAIEKLKAATSLLKTNAPAWNYLGLAYHHAGQTTNAAQAYQTALSLNHDLAEVHFNLGCLWLEQNRLDAAKAELITYTSLRKNSAEGWTKLGTAQLRSTRLEQRPLKPGAPAARPAELAAAEKSFAEALSIARSPEGLNGWGLTQLQRNRPRDAAQCFSDALKQQPDYAPALLNLAIVSQLYLNNHPFALQKYREYLALPVHRPDWEVVNTTARELEQELNATPPAPAATVPAPPASSADTAKPAHNPAARAGSSSASEPATNAPKAALTGRRAEENVEVARVSPEPAIKPAQDAVSAPGQTAQTKPVIASPKATGEPPNTRKPGFFSRMNPLNLLYHDSKPSPKSPALSADSGSATVEEAPGSGPHGVARYRYSLPAKPAAGDHSAAERVFAQGLQAQEADRFPEAIQSYRQATQLDPAYYDAYYNLGLAAAAAGSLQQALAAYETALAIRPESLDARYNFALVLKQANYLPDAVNELEKLLSSSPKEPRAHLALGNLYAQQLRQPKKAREHYLKVLENDPHNPQAEAIRYWLTRNPS